MLLVPFPACHPRYIISVPTFARSNDFVERFEWYRGWQHLQLLTKFCLNHGTLQGSFGGIVAIDIGKDFPQRCITFPAVHVRGKRRKRSNSEAKEKEVIGTSCTLCLKYNSMLFMDFVDDREMVIVEQPWLSVVATFPEALQRKVYGA
jgi:hypothetical protein